MEPSQIHQVGCCCWRAEVWVHKDLPGGQKQPSMQCSSQNWDRSLLVHVSAQEEPHSSYCMLKGHFLAEILKKERFFSAQSISS